MLATVSRTLLRLKKSSQSLSLCTESLISTFNYNFIHKMKILQKDKNLHQWLSSSLLGAIILVHTCLPRVIKLCCCHMIVSAARLRGFQTWPSWSHEQTGKSVQKAPWSPGLPVPQISPGRKQDIMSNLDKELLVWQQKTSLNINILELIYPPIKLQQWN